MVAKNVNVIGSSGGVNSDDANFEPWYNEKVQLFRNIIGGSQPFIPRQAKNKGWTNDHDRKMERSGLKRKEWGIA